jgi:hypothetical protein
MSGTEGVNSYFSRVGTPLFVSEGMNQGAIALFINRQIILNSRGGKAPPSLLVLDDLSEDTEAMSSKNMQFIYRKGRHINLNVWTLQQQAFDMKGFARNNTSVAIIFNTQNQDEHQKLYNLYGKNVFPTLGAFSAVLTHIGSNGYSAMIIECSNGIGNKRRAQQQINNDSSSLLNDAIGAIDRVYWYEASLAPSVPWYLGHPTMLEWAKRRISNNKVNNSVAMMM